MAKKRDLKRNINYICSDLFAESVAASLYGSQKNDDNLNALLASIIIVRNDFVKRISHPEPGMKTKLYYQNLITEFNHQVADIIDQIGTLG
jgi:hypothetical protein